MHDNKKLILVSGSKGMLGSALIQKLKELENFRVIGLCRRPESDDEVLFSLGTDFKFKTVRDGTFVHCAWNFEISEDDSWRINVEGSKRILGDAKSKGYKVLFISSASAFDAAKSIYGRHKYAVETFCIETGITFIRPGLIVFPSQGIFQSLVKLGRLFPVIPAVDGGRQNQHLVEINDLCETIAKTAIPFGDNERFGTKIVAAKTLVSVREILAHGSSGARRKLLILPVPAVLVSFALKILKKFRIKIGFDNESLLGLLYGPRESNIFTPRLERSESLVREIKANS